VSIPRVRVFPGTYRDSLLLLSATRAMQDESGVSWAAAVMATPANVEDLADRGISAADLDGADANALVLAVQAPDAPTARGLQRGHDALFAASRGAAPGQPTTGVGGPRRVPEANVAWSPVSYGDHRTPGSQRGACMSALQRQRPLPAKCTRAGQPLGRLVMGPGGHRHAGRGRPRIRQRGPAAGSAWCRRRDRRRR
jgi:FdrA protein